VTLAPLARSSTSHTTWSEGGVGKISSAVVESFVSADWTFAGAATRDNLHPYPARYVLDLPRQVLRLLAPGGPVLDPFCGSGTTLEASAMVGLAATGVDLNPIACLLSRVRVTPWTTEDESLETHHTQRLLDAAMTVNAEVVRERSARIPRVDHWFEPWAQEVLAGATAYLDTLSHDDPWRDRVALSISAAVVKISRQDSDTRYAAVDKRNDKTAGLAMLAKCLRRTSDVLRQRPWELRAPVAVHEGDARDISVLDDASHAAAIFSPPYPNAYEYWLYHKYRMYWLEADPIAVREAEMGARPHYFKTNGHTEVDFSLQMSDVFQGMGRVLAPRSPVVIVVGDSLIHGRVIDNRELLFDCARDVGFLPRAATARSIAKRRSSFNGAHGGGRDVEHVLLLESPV
jgi:site-specific DNA-methyltransferase (cytosine-N4-specific)